MSRYKSLVLTFDAFGTLFTLREPIGKQYAEVARNNGLSGFTDDQIASRFRAAFKTEALRCPNYGKAVGMNPSQWWSKIIRATFHPFSSENGLPERLVPDLLTRFSSAAGYVLYPDVLPFFEALRRTKEASHEDSAWSKAIVGVISNSDDRVPSILSNFGLQVGLWRYGSDPQASYKVGDDINFIMLSYDVGLVKPDPEIFNLTKEMVPGDRRFVHIGDDLRKDYHAAKRAGWDGYLLDREVEMGQQNVKRITGLQELASRIQQESPNIGAL